MSKAPAKLLIHDYAFDGMGKYTGIYGRAQVWIGDKHFEYIRNDAEAMRDAGYITMDEVRGLVHEIKRLKKELKQQLTTARNDALEEAVRAVMPDTMEISERATILRRKAAKIRSLKETLT